MSVEGWVVVYTAEGNLAAEMIRLTLESFGILAVLYEESVGKVYGLNAGPLAETQVLVEPSKAAEAIEILNDMENGRLEAPDESDGSKNSNKDGNTDITKDS